MSKGAIDQIRALKEKRHAQRTAANPPVKVINRVPPPQPQASAPAKIKRAAKPKAARRRELKPRRGRPRVEDRGKTLSDRKPWLAAKMSRATWYRRNKRAEPSRPGKG